MLHVVSNFGRLLPVLLLLLGLPGIGRSETNGSSTPQLLRIGQLLGKTVETRDGQPVGSLRNLLIDPTAGTLRFVIVAPDGIIAARTRLRVVPPDLMSASTAKRDVLAFNVIRPVWDEAPTFKSGEVLALHGSGRAREVTDYFKIETAGEISTVPHRADKEKPQLRPTGLSRSRSEPVEPWLATDFIGRSVLSQKREKLGEVLDLLIAFDQRSPVLVLMRSARLPDDEGQVFAIPLNALDLDSERFVLAATRACLAEARWFDPRSWTTSAATVGTPPVFRYELPGSAALP